MPASFSNEPIEPMTTNLAIIRAVHADLLAAGDATSFREHLHTCRHKGVNLHDAITFGGYELIFTLMERNDPFPYFVILHDLDLLSDGIVLTLAKRCTFLNHFDLFRRLYTLRPALFHEPGTMAHLACAQMIGDLAQWIDVFTQMQLLQPERLSVPGSAEDCIFNVALVTRNIDAIKRLVAMGMAASIHGSAPMRVVAMATAYPAQIHDACYFLARGAQIADRAYAALAFAILKESWSLARYLMQYACQYESEEVIRQVMLDYCAAQRDTRTHSRLLAGLQLIKPMPRAVEPSAAHDAANLPQNDPWQRVRDRLLGVGIDVVEASTEGHNPRIESLTRSGLGPLVNHLEERGAFLRRSVEHGRTILVVRDRLPLGLRQHQGPLEPLTLPIHRPLPEAGDLATPTNDRPYYRRFNRHKY